MAAYFNPAGFKRRRENFHAFRASLQVPLLAVELAKPGRHELRDGDADILISLTGEDRIWQKERLINIGLGRLPEHVRYVAWLDADLIFDNAEWPAAAKAWLDQGGGVVQLFGCVAHQPERLDPSAASPEVCRDVAPLFTGLSVERALREGLFESNRTKFMDALPARGTDRFYALIDRNTVHGMAWAARREVVEACGTFDMSILGGGDAVLTAAAMGRLDSHLADRGQTAAHRIASRAWARRAREAGLFKRFGSLEQQAYHLWHGDLPDRGYLSRYATLARHDFDPARDLELADNATWRWADPNSALADEVEAYFFSRFEDGRG